MALIAALVVGAALLLTYVIMSNYYGATSFLVSGIIRVYQVIIVLVAIPTFFFLVTSGQVRFIVAGAVMLVIGLLFLEFEVLRETDYSLVQSR